MIAMFITVEIICYLYYKKQGKHFSELLENINRVYGALSGDPFLDASNSTRIFNSYSYYLLRYIKHTKDHLLYLTYIDKDLK